MKRPTAVKRGTPRPRLVVFVKAPVPGRVKTRLGREIGMIAACWWFRHQTAALIRRLGRDPRWVMELAVSPDLARAARHWPGNVPRRAQGGGDLGQRMCRVLRTASPGPVAIIGADIPAIRPRHIARAFRILSTGDAVLGPATDGGYWLIGLKRGAQAIPARMFDRVRWSTSHALADTYDSLQPLRTRFADSLDDVDTAEDLRRHAATSLEQNRTGPVPGG